MIETWRIQAADLSWALDLATRRYPTFDRMATARWAIGVLHEPRIYMRRTRAAFVVGSLEAKVWLPKQLSCHMLFLCAEPGAHWQAMTLLRRLREWAIANQATRLFVGTDTGIDLGPMVNRLQPRGVSEDRWYVLML